MALTTTGMEARSPTNGNLWSSAVFRKDPPGEWPQLSIRVLQPVPAKPQQPRWKDASINQTSLTSFSGPSAGESVSKQIELRGSCFTSFCFLEKRERTFKTGRSGSALTYTWTSLVLRDMNIHLYHQSSLDSYHALTSPLLMATWPFQSRHTA